MIPQAVLIGRLKIDMDTLLATAKQLLGRSPSRKLDSQGKSIDNASGYLTILAALKNEDIDQNTVLEDPGHLLAHCYFTFMIACDNITILELMEKSRLVIQKIEVRNGCLAIVAGTLEQWRTAIINCCSEQSDFNLRLLFDKILLIFESEGLGKLWSRYGKKTLADQTFKLIERK